MYGCNAGEDEVFEEKSYIGFIQLHKEKMTISCNGCLRENHQKQKKEGENFKAYLVAKGNSKYKGVGYEENFSSVFKHTSICVVLAFVASPYMYLEQMNVKTTFLHGNLDEQIYMD